MAWNGRDFKDHVVSRPLNAFIQYSSPQTRTVYQTGKSQNKGSDRKQTFVYGLPLLINKRPMLSYKTERCNYMTLVSQPCWKLCSVRQDSGFAKPRARGNYRAGGYNW